MVALLVGGALVVQSTAASSTGADVLEFGTMAGVVEPFTGLANPIRGLPGGGLPWEARPRSGRAAFGGTSRDPGRGTCPRPARPGPGEPARYQPGPQFRAIVSFLKPGSAGQVDTVNLTTDPMPATPTGTRRSRRGSPLSEPCIAPIVFVTSPTGAWFAATGR